MNSIGKIIYLSLFFLLTIFFITPICAEPLPNEEKPIFNENKTEINEGNVIDDESADESVIDDINVINDKNAINEELSLGEQPLYDKEINNDSSIDEDDLFNDDSFVFEAPTLVFEVPVFETRSFNEIFPNLSPSQKRAVTSNMGIRYSFEKTDSPTLVPNRDSGIDLLSKVMQKKPSHIVEALILVPYNKRELDMLDVYNAMRNIKDIQNYIISLRGRDYKIFMDTTRIESAQNRKPIDDPPHADTLPLSETMYLCFVDRNMGDLYLRGNISVSLFGITYNLTNFRDVFYSIFRVMKAEKFITIIYVEPVKEGVLIYSMSGLYIPSFIADRVQLSSSMNYRITVLVNWIIDGLKREETYSKTQHFYEIQ